jgi:hypothetical protein
MNTYPPIEDRRDTPLVGFIKGAICFALMFGFACIAQSATIPALVHSAGSQPYNFDRIDASEIAWYSALYGPNEIPSAPRRMYRGSHEHTDPGAVGSGGNGHDSHGNGNGYGHEKHHATPEPAPAVMLLIGFGALAVARMARWRLAA